MKAEMEVVQPGLFSTIQDLGRFGFLKYGVPMSGAMDMYSAKMANLILHNSDHCAVMEITQMGPKLKFSAPVEISITGANLSPMINNVEVKNNVILRIGEGEVLSFGKRQNGCRSYLAISGGFQTEEIFGSRSWFEGLTEYSRCEKGLKLYYNSFTGSHGKTFSAIKVQNNFLRDEKLMVFPGPEYGKLPQEIKKNLAQLNFTVGKLNNRMGVQLEEILENQLNSIITGPVVPGTVQLTPGGKLIVLMKDCQITGGYPRVLQLTQKAIDILSQKVTGDKIIFRITQG